MKTTSYGISKKLKEAGFNATAEKCWAKICLSKTEEFILSPLTFEVPANCDEWYPAYDLETLLNALKQTGKKIMIVGKSDNWGINFNYEFNIYSKENESLADTAGKMWLLLKEKGII